MYSAEGAILCASCVEKEGQGKQVVRLIDPTVCARCGRDEGSHELPRLGRLPMCEACTHAVRNVPFPAWLRFAFVGLVAIAAGSFVLNQRFFSAYAAMVRAGRQMKEGRFDRAAALLESAAEKVPESQDLRAELNLVKAIQFMQEDRSAEAVPLLRACLEAAPGDANLKKMLLQAEVGAAFEAQDYDTFLKKSLEVAEQNPNEPTAQAGVASAYACKYAAQGDEEFARQARERLEAARKLAPPTDADFDEYSQRIQFRLATREIISRAEFHRRFPSGWHPAETK